MKYRQAWKIFVWSLKKPIRLSTWDKAIDRVFTSRNFRRGWKNIKRGKLWDDK